MLRTLMQSGDFLALTLANPDGFERTGSVLIGDHTRVEIHDTGILVFEPLKPGHKDIILSSGVHGNETAPIELCNELIRKLLKDEIRSHHRIMFLFGNPHAMFNGTRIVDENLNRLFSGEHSRGPGLSNPERHRAKRLEQAVDLFFSQEPSGEPERRHRIHYDLHTAIRGAKYEKFAIYPYRQGRPYSKEQLSFLDAAGVNCVLFHHEPTTTFSYFSSNGYGADAFTIELGKVFPMGQNDMTRFIAMEQMLTALITDQGLNMPDYDPKRLHLYRVSRSIVKHADDFEFTFANDVENFTSFSRGVVLAREAGQDIVVEEDREAIVFPNAKVPIGQRTLLCLVPVESPEVM